MTVLLFLLAVIGGGALGTLFMALAVAGVRADLLIETGRAQCEAAIAHTVGDEMAAELASHLRRKDFGASSRKRIGDLLLRWGALRPAASVLAAPEVPAPEQAA